MALIGYARCSTTDQNLEDRVRRLEDAGCTRMFEEAGVSGKLDSRPVWDACRDYLRSGEDTLVITKLDRAGRSVRHLIESPGCSTYPDRSSTAY